MGKHSCDEWEERYNVSWAKDNFMTRRLCGFSCVRADPITEWHFQKARENLMKFDIVLVTNRLNEGLCLMNKTGASVILSHAERSVSSRKNNFGDDCDNNFKERIRKDYWADNRLYELAVKLFEDNLERYPMCKE